MAAPGIAEIDRRAGSAASNRTGRSIWTFLAGAGSSVAVLLVGMFSTPLLLRLLGAERYGASRALIDVFGMIGLLELGLTGSVMTALAKPIGQGDDLAVRRALVTALRVYLMTTALMLTGAIGLIAVLPHLISVERLSAEELRWAGVVSASAVLLAPAAVFRALAETMQRGYIVHAWVTFQLLLTTALLSLAAWLELGLPGQSAAMVLAMIPPAIALIAFGCRKYPGFWRAAPDREVRRTIRQLNWRMFFYHMTGRLSLHSDSIIIASILGSAWVAPFYLSQRLTSMAQGQLGGIGNSSWAALIDLYNKGEAEKFESRLLQLTRMVSGLGLAVLGPLAAYNHAFIRLWVGNNYGGDLLTVLASCNIWIWSILSLWGWAITAVGEVRRILGYAILSTATNVLVSIVGTMSIGLPGPLLGTFAGNLLVQSWAFPKVMQEIFKLEPGRLLPAALSQTVWGIPYAAAVWGFARWQPAPNWFSLIAGSGVSIACGLMLWWVFGASEADRNFWRERIPAQFRFLFGSNAKS